MSGNTAKPAAYLDLKLNLAKAFFDAGSELLQSFIKFIPVTGDALSKLLDKFGTQTVWVGIEKLVRQGEADRTVEWNRATAENMAITSLDNSNLDIDMENFDQRSKALSGFLSFADSVFGKGARVIVKMYNIAITIAGFFAPKVDSLKLDQQQQDEILGSLDRIREASKDLAEANVAIGASCVDLLNGSK